MKKNLEIRALQTLEKTEDNVVEGYALKFNKESRNLGGFVETISPEALEGVDLTWIMTLVSYWDAHQVAHWN